MSWIREILRIIIGLIFVVSGSVKAIDPVGFSFKLDEYFSPSVFNLEFLIPYTLFLSIFVVVIEIVLGLFLLLKIKLRWTIIALILLCVFFGFLTFYSAYYDVVTDCGCFGDAVKLTPWQSFWKDIVLLAALFILFQFYKESRKFNFNKFNILSLVCAVFLLVFVLHRGVRHEPLVDFREYKIGTDLKAEKLKIEQNPSQYKTIYTLSNSSSGKTLEVSQDDYISKNYWKDENWKINEDKTKEILIQKGYESSISQFNIEDEAGNDITEKILNAPRAILVFSYKPEQIDMEYLAKFEEKLKSQKNVLALGVSTRKDIHKSIPNHFMDGTAIKTIARSNPFVLVLENGVIVKKANIKDIKNL